MTIMAIAAFLVADFQTFTVSALSKRYYLTSIIIESCHWRPAFLSNQYTEDQQNDERLVAWQIKEVNEKG